MILWVRHGQSTWNAIDRLQGHELGPPLTDLGRAQAAAVAEELSRRGVAHVLASPAVRAQQTAQVVADRLGLEVVTEPLLLEKGLEESVPSVVDRVHRLLALELPADTVAVSHGDTIGLAVGLLAGRSPGAPANASILSVDPATRAIEQWLPSIG